MIWIHQRLKEEKIMGVETVRRCQLLAMAYVSLLSPAIRVIPRLSAVLGGKAVWLSPVAAILAAAGIGFVLDRCVSAAGQQRGLAELITDTLGPIFGRVLLGVYVLWFVFYAGFILRTAAERLISAVYSQGHLPVFLGLMLLVTLVAACGKIGALGRMAEVSVPVIALILVAVLIASIPSIEKDYLFPILPADLPQILLGALPMADVMGVMIPFAFFADKRKPGADGGSVTAWMALTVGSLAVLTVPVIGCLSAPITQSQQNTFFVMLRNIVLFDSVERIEPLVIGLWIITDFVYTAALLMLSGHLSTKIVAVRKRNVFVVPAAVLALLAAVFCDRGSFDMQTLSDFVIPITSSTLSMAVPVLVLLAAALKNARGKLRKNM
jgi:spore germination protein KB